MTSHFHESPSIQYDHIGVAQPQCCLQGVCGPGSAPTSSSISLDYQGALSMTAENQCPCKRVALPDLEAFQYCPLDCSIKHLFRVTSTNDHNGVFRPSAPSRNTSHHYVFPWLEVMVRMPANRHTLCLVFISRNVSRPAYFLCFSRALPLDIFKTLRKSMILE